MGSRSAEARLGAPQQRAYHLTRRKLSHGSGKRKRQSVECSKPRSISAPAAAAVGLNHKLTPMHTNGCWRDRLCPVRRKIFWDDTEIVPPYLKSSSSIAAAARVDRAVSLARP